MPRNPMLEDDADALNNAEKPKRSDYVKTRILGFGSMCQVWLVTDKKTGATQCMKQLSRRVAVRKNKVEHLVAEKALLEEADHPFICSLYASFRRPEYNYLVMEFAPGGELFTLVKRQPERRIPESWAEFYVAEMVCALEYIHCLGFIYRDLKLENVLLRADGHILLCDFNSCKRVAVTPASVGPACASGTKNFAEFSDWAVNQNPTHTMVGTLEYMSPEVLLSDPEGPGYGVSADWWQVGIILYEMLFGFTPFSVDLECPVPDLTRTMRRSQIKAKLLAPGGPKVRFPQGANHVSSSAARTLIRGLLGGRDKAHLAPAGTHVLGRKKKKNGLWTLVRRAVGGRSNRFLRGSIVTSAAIKQHPFFNGQNFALLASTEPPYVPPTDFEKNFMSESRIAELLHEYDASSAQQQMWAVPQDYGNTTSEEESDIESEDDDEVDEQDEQQKSEEEEGTTMAAAEDAEATTTATAPAFLGDQDPQKAGERAEKIRERREAQKQSIAERRRKRAAEGMVAEQTEDEHDHASPDDDTIMPVEKHDQGNAQKMYLRKTCIGSTAKASVCDDDGPRGCGCGTDGASSMVSTCGGTPHCSVTTSSVKGRV